MKNLYSKTKSALKDLALLYCVLGNIYGVTMHLTGHTTGHVSSDIYLGLVEPTKFEKGLVNLLNPENKK